MNDNDDNKLDRVTLEQVRIRVARQVVEEGVRAEDAAAALGLSRSAVYAWVVEVPAGRAGRAAPAGGAGARAQARRTAAGPAVQAWSAAIPARWASPQALWTRDLVRQLIRQQFGVSLTLAPVGKLLRRLGLSPQRPAWRAYEQDPDAVERWKTERYPAIRAEAAEAGATIFFVDEAGISWDEHAGTTWAPVGHTPVVTSTGKHIKVNLISAVTARGALRFAVYGDSLQRRGVHRLLPAAGARHARPGVPGPRRAPGAPRRRGERTSTAGTDGRLRLCFLPRLLT
jgi:transposase